MKDALRTCDDEESDLSAHISSADPIGMDIPCLRCGYNLRGLTGERCPECGHSIEAARSTTSLLPWVHGGRFRFIGAFWKTVCFVIFKPSYMVVEASRDVSLREAQRFRWCAIPWVYPAIAVQIVSWHKTWSVMGHELPWLDTLFRAKWPVAVYPLLLFLLMAVGTGLPSYFFHPRDEDVARQNHAVALSYYTSAFLPLLNLAALLAVVGHGLARRAWLSNKLISIADILIPITLVLWVAYLVHLNRRMFPNRPGRALALAALLPLTWVLTILGVMIALPGVFLFVWIVLKSLA